MDDSDFQHDQEVQKPALPASPDENLRAGHEAISQILFSILLAVHTAKRAAANNPRRVPELLELIREQSAAAIEQLRLLRGIP